MAKSLLNNSICFAFISIVLLSCAGEASMEDTSANLNDDRMAEPAEEIVGFEETSKVSSLTGSQRSAFETKAMQKLQDFFDYLKIISDPEVDTDLRKHSYKLALELFSSDTVTVTDSLLNNGDPLLIKDYLSSILIKKNKVVPLVNKVVTIQPLNVDSMGRCRGKLNAVFNLRKQVLDKTVDVHLIEVEKAFGESNQRTIEVKLGNIY